MFMFIFKKEEEEEMQYSDNSQQHHGALYTGVNIGYIR